jgi:hypothetical protein
MKLCPNLHWCNCEVELNDLHAILTEVFTG